MALRHTKPSRIQSQDEREKRQYHSEVRKFIKRCTDLNIPYWTYENAAPDCVCVLSKSDYDLCEPRGHIEEDNESYFLSQKDYEEKC